MLVLLPVMYASRVSSGTSDQSCSVTSVISLTLIFLYIKSWDISDLVEVDRGLPVVVSEQVKVAHTDFTEVTRRDQQIFATASASSEAPCVNCTYPGWYLSMFVL